MTDYKCWVGFIGAIFGLGKDMHLSSYFASTARTEYPQSRRLSSTFWLPELKYGKAIEEYSFAAFDEYVKDKGMFGEFAPYDFK